MAFAPDLVGFHLIQHSQGFFMNTVHPGDNVAACVPEGTLDTGRRIIIRLLTVSPAML